MANSEPVDWAMIAADYAAGVKSVKAIAQGAGVSVGAIYQRAAREQWPARSAAKARRDMLRGCETGEGSRGPGGDGHPGATVCAPPAAEGQYRQPRRARKPLSVRQIRGRMLEVLTNQLEQLAAINERHPNDGALNERSARAMATIVNAIDKLIELELKGGGASKEPDPEQHERLLHIMRAELAERLGGNGAGGQAGSP